jgi:hypothetical protein
VPPVGLGIHLYDNAVFTPLIEDEVWLLGSTDLYELPCPDLVIVVAVITRLLVPLARKDDEPAICLRASTCSKCIRRKPAIH